MASSVTQRFATSPRYQETGSSALGRGYIDVEGGPLAGVPIKLKQRGPQTTTTTDVRGCYSFQNVGLGRGTITIEVP